MGDASSTACQRETSQFVEAPVCPEPHAPNPSPGATCTGPLGGAASVRDGEVDDEEKEKEEVEETGDEGEREEDEGGQEERKGGVSLVSAPPHCKRKRAVRVAVDGERQGKRSRVDAGGERGEKILAPPSRMPLRKGDDSSNASSGEEDVDAYPLPGMTTPTVNVNVLQVEQAWRNAKDPLTMACLDTLTEAVCRGGLQFTDAHGEVLVPTLEFQNVIDQRYDKFAADFVRAVAVQGFVIVRVSKFKSISYPVVVPHTKACVSFTTPRKRPGERTYTIKASSGLEPTEEMRLALAEATVLDHFSAWSPSDDGSLQSPMACLATAYCDLAYNAACHRQAVEQRLNSPIFLQQPAEPSRVTTNLFADEAIAYGYDAEDPPHQRLGAPQRPSVPVYNIEPPEETMEISKEVSNVLTRQLLTNTNGRYVYRSLLKLPPGMVAVPVPPPSSTPDDREFRHDVGMRICSAFGVPPGLVGLPNHGGGGAHRESISERMWVTRFEAMVDQWKRWLGATLTGAMAVSKVGLHRHLETTNGRRPAAGTITISLVEGPPCAHSNGEDPRVGTQALRGHAPRDR